MDIKEWIKFAEDNIMTKQETREFLEMSDSAINQSLDSGRLKPVFERGKGRSMVRLFYRRDVEKYKKSVEAHRKRLKK